MITEGEKPGEDEEALWYLRRLDGGLFTLQTVDYILAWLTMEDDGVSHIRTGAATKTNFESTPGSVAYQANAQSQEHVTAGSGQDIGNLS